MTYIGQLLERLISLFSFYLLHSSCMYWLGRVTSFLFVCLFKPVIICRGLWAKCSAHTCEQNPRSDSGRGDPCTSPDCSLPTEMQTYAEMASLSFLVFCNIILGSTSSYFPFFYCQHYFSSELYYPVTSEEAKLCVSAWQESSTCSKCVTSCISLHFHLEWWSLWSLRRQHGAPLDGHNAGSNWAAVASVLARNEPVVFE